MKRNCKTSDFRWLGLLPLVLFLGACGRTGDDSAVPGGAEPAAPGSSTETEAFPYTGESVPRPADLPALGAEEKESLLLSLENIAALERAGAFSQGLGIRESVIREKLGDFSGAVAAAYKELAWGYGTGLIQKEQLEQGLHNALDLEGEPAQAARGILAFVRGQWPEAHSVLHSFLDEEDPDSFTQWMILCCALEQNKNDKRSAAAYKAIRARYENFPEYWYRGARFFSGIVAAQYAEHCVTLAPDGPFSGDCRAILASYAGLNPKDGSALRSRNEIENLISLSVNRRDPALLAPLVPLISLPDNSYTVYASGALRALAAIPQFREYFTELAERSSGRLAERLAYICRAGL